MNYNETLGLARHLINLGLPLEEAIKNSVIPEEFRDKVCKSLKEEETVVFQPANLLVDDEAHTDWLNYEDRSGWYYWPSLRQYLLTKREWSNSSVQLLDKNTDKILGRLSSPLQQKPFDKRGLVLGYVQSGKTSSYTALIAKAADSGYKFIIVLTGTDNGLRLQTNRRLKKELVGGSDDRGVPLPKIEKQWHEFTRDDLNGDFNPGYVNYLPLQDTHPILLVIKKNGSVLRRLLSWLECAPKEVMNSLPLLVIDDEADLASIDTKGSYQSEEEPLPADYEPPSVINRLIRDLLNRFSHKAYVAYTATPFANVLIPHDNHDQQVNNDLYPSNFIVSLPKPNGYFGAEELFGRMDDISEEETDGINVIREVPNPESDDFFLEKGIAPPNYEKAILSFVLAGAARSKRENKDFPATMLVHISLRIIDQMKLFEIIEKKFSDLRDEWRYARKEGIYDKLSQLWEEDFLPVINTRHPDKAIDFKELELNISSFFESVQIRIVNSSSGDVLDYEKEPNLKAIAIGGNKLSRGLTLEGLLVSFFTRRTKQYDTLMQMGRWFGFREGYEDLTRIYTLSELAEWFSDLAQVEYQLREDIKIYEEQQLTPLEVGMRVKAHPIMQVTGPSKRRFASELIVSKMYDGKAPQTLTFPLDNLEVLARNEDDNLFAIKEFLSELGSKYALSKRGPVWSNVSSEKVLYLLDKFSSDKDSHSFNLPLIIKYIQQLNKSGELIKWTIGICGRESFDPELGQADWGLGKEVKINQINLSKIAHTNTLKAIVSQGDETTGMPREEIEKVDSLVKNNNIQKNQAARLVRSLSEGLLLLYPISKNSKASSSARAPLFNNSGDSLARNLIGMAISFPGPTKKQFAERYIEGTIPGRSTDDFQQ